MKLRDVLGLNSRNHLYTSVYNTRKGKEVANSKLFTKKILKTVGIRVPETYAVINNMEVLEKFDFLKLPTDFVVKPNNGLGGQGIVVVEKRGEYAGEWIDSQGDAWGVEDLKLHMADILAGRYSMDDVSDIAYIEERVRVHPSFTKYSYHGTPDIRVIVFNKIPIMSYVRLPTEESGGRANLFQGAAAAGIDIATGVTTYGVHHGRPIEFFPGTRRKLANIQIPQWEEILTTAIKASEAIGLGYMACDIVLQPMIQDDRQRGKSDKLEEVAVPMILEVNAQPGLKIQIANRAGLRERLARVKGLKVVSARHGIRVGQALFADIKLAEKGLGRKSVSAVEEVQLLGYNGERGIIKAKVDTGANMSSIDRELAEKLGLMDTDNRLYEDYFFSSLGRNKREIVGIKYVMAGVKVKSMVSVSDRSRMKHKFLVGKRDLKQFVVVVD
ncbi:MAG: sugar-transfer associated ATP-grasp domain-containing protein [bacterium]